jgi:hypothetical protein
MKRSLLIAVAGCWLATHCGSLSTARLLAAPPTVLAPQTNAISETSLRRSGPSPAAPQRFEAEPRVGDVSLTSEHAPSAKQALSASTTQLADTPQLADATQLPDATQLADATQLPDATQLADATQPSGLAQPDDRSRRDPAEVQSDPTLPSPRILEVLNRAAAEAASLNPLPQQPLSGVAAALPLQPAAPTAPALPEIRLKAIVLADADHGTALLEVGGRRITLPLKRSAFPPVPRPLTPLPLHAENHTADSHTTDSHTAASHTAGLGNSEPPAGEQPSAEDLPQEAVPRVPAFSVNGILFYLEDFSAQALWLRALDQPLLVR